MWMKCEQRRAGETEKNERKKNTRSNEEPQRVHEAWSTRPLALSLSLTLPRSRTHTVVVWWWDVQLILLKLETEAVVIYLVIRRKTALLFTDYEQFPSVKSMSEWVSERTNEEFRQFSIEMYIVCSGIHMAAQPLLSSPPTPPPPLPCAAVLFVSNRNGWRAKVSDRKRDHVLLSKWKSIERWNIASVCIIFHSLLNVFNYAKTVII